jgi:hypothetical protein
MKDTTMRAVHEIREQLFAMLNLEAQHYKPIFQGRHTSSNPLSEAHSRRQQFKRKRATICGWFYTVSDHFGFSRECVAYALSFFDKTAFTKFKDFTEPIENEDFKLLAIAAFYLALKLHGDVVENHERRTVQLKQMVDLGRGQFSAKSIEMTELVILNILDYHVHPPTAVSFIHWMIQLCPLPLQVNDDFRAKVKDIAVYICEITAMDYDCCNRHPASTMAYAALLCAMDSLQLQISAILADFVRTSFLQAMADLLPLSPTTPNVRECMRAMKDLVPGYFVPIHGVSQSSSHHHRDKTPAKKLKAREDVPSPVAVDSFDDARFCKAETRHLI